MDKLVNLTIIHTHVKFAAHKVDIADYKLLRLIYLINKLSNLMLKNILTRT